MHPKPDICIVLDLSVIICRRRRIVVRRTFGIDARPVLGWMLFVYLLMARICLRQVLPRITGTWYPCMDMWRVRGAPPLELLALSNAINVTCQPCRLLRHGTVELVGELREAASTRRVRTALRTTNPARRTRARLTMNFSG